MNDSRWEQSDYRIPNHREIISFRPNKERFAQLQRMAIERGHRSILAQIDSLPNTDIPRSGIPAWRQYMWLSMQQQAHPFDGEDWCDLEDDEEDEGIELGTKH